MLFYIIFWDYPINPEPSASFCFFVVFEFYRKGIPNGVQLTCQFLWIFYGPKEDPGVKELRQKSPGPSTRVGARPREAGAPPCLMASLLLS